MRTAWPTCKPVLGVDALAVHPQLALAHDALDVTEGQAGKPRLQETVDAHIGFVGRDGDGLHRRRQFRAAAVSALLRYPEAQTEQAPLEIVARRAAGACSDFDYDLDRRMTVRALGDRPSPAASPVVHGWGRSNSPLRTRTTARPRRLPAASRLPRSMTTMFHAFGAPAGRSNVARTSASAANGSSSARRRSISAICSGVSEMSEECRSRGLKKRCPVLRFISILARSAAWPSIPAAS